MTSQEAKDTLNAVAGILLICKLTGTDAAKIACEAIDIMDHKLDIEKGK